MIRALKVLTGVFPMRYQISDSLYKFLAKLKTRIVIEEYKCNVYDKHEETETRWARLADIVAYLVFVYAVLHNHILPHVV